MAIIIFFVAHWILAVFFQTFFLHRYGAHKMFTMSHRMERVFHFLTYIFQGCSFLNPRAYAILHREHHAFSDTERDPHSPTNSNNPMTMMLKTKDLYDDHLNHRSNPEKPFLGNYPEWPLIDNFSRTWISRFGFGALYTFYYIAFATEWWHWLLLPIQYVMGPVHGAIVNWCGHKYGYRNFKIKDVSRNTLVVDFLTLGELFQNNHHQFGNRLNFGVKWFEVDIGYNVIRLFAWIGLIKLGPEPTSPGSSKAPDGLLNPLK
jgi:stearoyl-CoA desaturase (delta-9 desaturase)